MIEKLRKRKGTSLVVPITTFAPEPYDVIRRLEVVVQPSDEEYIATFFDANVNASGCTETEAVANLKDVMLALFEYFASLPAKRLGPGPKRQFAVLRKFIRRRR